MTLDEAVEAIGDYRLRKSIEVSRWVSEHDKAFFAGLDAGLEWVLLMLKEVDTTPPKQNWDQP